MTDNRETIAMLKVLKEQALKSHNDTAVLKVTIDSFNFVIDKAIKALETVSCIKEKCAYCPHCENCDVDDETLEIKALEQQACDLGDAREDFIHDVYNTLDEDSGNTGS